MIIYILMTLISLLFVYLSEKANNKTLKILFEVLAALPFFIISAIRYKVGTDYTFRYVGDFQNIAKGIDVENLELGFKLIIKICLLFSNNSQWLFVFTSAIITFFVMLTIFTESKNTMVSVLIFFIGGFFFQSLNMVRQFLAMAIIFFSHKYLFENKKIKYFLIAILVAFFIHSSSIVMLILLFTKDKLILRPIVTVPIVIIILFFGQYIMEFITPIIDNTRYDVYLVGLYAKGEKSILYNTVNLIIYLFIHFLYKIKLKRQKIEKRDIFFINVQGLALIFTFMSSVHMLFARIANYFMIFQIIAIPYFIETTQIKEIHLGNKWTKRVLYMIVIIFFAGLTTYTNIIHNDNEPIPYKTIFNKEREFK